MGVIADSIRNSIISEVKNAKYYSIIADELTSKTIQNELLGVVADSIRNSIISVVKSAKYYSIIADELTDTANHEELSLVYRYVHNEEIVDFLEIERITGRVLGNAWSVLLVECYALMASGRGKAGYVCV